MSPFRTLVAGLCAAAITVPSLAAAACLQPAEKAAFDVHTLQTALMVAALNCKQEDEYNAFVTKFRPDLGTSYRGVAGHFRRTGGGVRRLDDHITSLANAHSQDSIRQGSAFCDNTTPRWAEVMQLRNRADLARYSTERAVTQIYTVEACPTRAAPAQRSAGAQRPQGQQQQARASGGTQTR